jgi:hypothetical protein
MPELRINTDWTYRGLRVVTLENRYLRVLVLPEAGAKIWQITYKPFDVDLLWNNCRNSPAHLAMNSRYDDVWSGGWDELFPNDEVATIDGETYPDHGELWTGKWDFEPFSSADAVGVTLTYLTPISGIQVEKTITLRRESARIFFQHRFTNVGRSPFPFLWKLHPAMDVTPDHRIDFPPMQVELEPAFPGTLEGAPPRSTWPCVCVGNRQVDLRQVPRPEERQLYFFYGTELKQGWCALTNANTGLACGWHYDPAVFSCAWLFATYGGWRNYNVAVLEPCTGYPLNFAAMQAAGRHKILAPGQTLSTDILFSVQEGLKSVGEVKRDGTMNEAG